MASKHDLPDFAQAPAAVHTGNAPVAGVFYEWRNHGVAAHYFLATGEVQKNGKHVMRMHDLHCGPRKKVTKAGVDARWFAQMVRCETVPGYVHALLTAE